MHRRSYRLKPFSLSFAPTCDGNNKLTRSFSILKDTAATEHKMGGYNFRAIDNITQLTVR